MIKLWNGRKKWDKQRFR